MNKYEELLEKLEKGEIAKLEVPHAEYFMFREAWLKKENRMHFIGEAHLGGNITYHYTGSNSKSLSHD